MGYRGVRRLVCVPDAVRLWPGDPTCGGSSAWLAFVVATGVVATGVVATGMVATGMVATGVVGMAVGRDGDSIVKDSFGPSVATSTVSVVMVT